MSHFNSNNKKGIFFVLTFIFLSNIILNSYPGIHQTNGSVLVENLSHDKSANRISTDKVSPESSIAPTFNQTLSVDNSLISPQNLDGNADNATFSFTPSMDCQYNFSIEEDVQLVDYKSRYVTVAGNSSKLLMIQMVGYYNDYNGYAEKTTVQIFARESLDLGLTWSAPQETNLSHFNSSGNYYKKLDLVYNASEGMYYLMTTFNPEYVSPSPTNICFWKSPDGINWTYLSDLAFYLPVWSSAQNINSDMILSANSSEILVVSSSTIFPNPSNPMNEILFFKSRNGGKSWSNLTVTASYGNSPVISMSPINNQITIAWLNGTGDYLAPNYFCMSSSSSFGASWDTPLELNSVRGIGLVSTKSWDNFAQMEYDSNGRLNALIVVNNSKIYSLISLDNGKNWLNYSSFREFSVDSYVYQMSYLDFHDGNTTLSYIGSQNGNFAKDETVGGYVFGYGSSYFVRPQIIIKQLSQAASKNVEKTIFWNGKNPQGQYVRDGNYLARVWLKNVSTGEITSIPSEKQVKVDNSASNIVPTLINGNFSPNASPGVKDTMQLTFTAEEDVNYNVTIENSLGYTLHSEMRVTSLETTEYHSDIAVDDSNKLWVVYTSYQDNNKDLYLKTSNDYGMTWDLPIPLVVDTAPDDCASIAIRGQSIYIVFMRWHSMITNPSQYLYDLYFMKSDTLGQTWTTPQNITALEYLYPTVSAFTPVGYTAPEICVTQNGTIFIASYLNIMFQSARLFRSVDGGTSFTYLSTYVPAISGQTSTTAISLVFEESTQTLFYALLNNTIPYYYNKFALYSSNDQGDSWNYVSGFQYNGDRNNGYATLGDQFPLGMSMEINNNGDFYLTILNNTKELIRYKSITQGSTWTYLGSLILDTNNMKEDGKYYSNFRSGCSSTGDIFYTYDRNPSLLANRDVYVLPFSKTVKFFQGSSAASIPCVIEWDGFDYWNTMQEGMYYVNVSIQDFAGNLIHYSYESIIDNSIMQISSAVLTSESMSPINSQIVYAVNLTNADANVDLYYRFLETEPWMILPTEFNGTHFNATIPANLAVSNAYFYFNASDTAGNSYCTSIQNYFEPIISITIQNLDQIMTQSAWAPFSLTVIINSGTEFIDLFYVSYVNGTENVIILLEQISTTRYVLPQINVLNYPAKMNYRLFLNYTNSKSVSLNNFSLSAPTINFNVSPDKIQASFTSLDSERKLDDEIHFSITTLPVLYVQDVFLDYKFNNATQFTTLRMSLINETIFSTIIQGSPQMFSLEYKIRVVDIWNTTHIISQQVNENAIFQEYIPLYPVIQLSWQNQIYLVMISAICGLFFSVLYLQNKRSSIKRIQNRFIETLRNKSISDKDKIAFALPAENTLPTSSSKQLHILERGRFIYGLGKFSTLAIIGLVLWSYYTFETGVIALLIATVGLFVSSLTLVERILIDISDSIYADKKTHSIGAYIYMIFVAVILLLFLLAGTKIEWFNYYVINETFDVSGVKIPRLWISLVSVFITSLVIVVISSYHDLNHTRKRLEIMKIAGENFKVIWQQREENVSKMNSNVGFKTIIFIATVAFSVISTTNLGQYAELGIMMLLPFVLVVLIAFVFDLIFSAQKPSVRDALQSWIIDETKICPECQTMNVFDNIYCTKCKHHFSKGMQIFDKTIVCKICKNHSPQDSVFCRSCGAELNSNPKTK